MFKQVQKGEEVRVDIQTSSKGGQGRVDVQTSSKVKKETRKNR